MATENKNEQYDWTEREGEQLRWKNSENVDKNSAYAYVKEDVKTYKKNLETMLIKTVMGYKLPIRLVKNK